MARHGLHHLALTASNLSATGVFYDGVLRPVGYSRHLTREHLLTWQGPGPELLIYRAKAEAGEANENIYSPGIHHLAFQVEAPDNVTQVYDFARNAGFRIVDAPSRYDHYSEGYFAVYVLDPDGIKIEVAHIPVPTS